MKGSAKIGIIITIIILLIIALAIGGYFVYAKTDLLQSNQNLFLKYMGQALESLEYVENTQMTEIANLKEEMPYTVQGTLSCETEENASENATILSNMKVNVQASVNKPEEKAYATTKLRYQDQDLFTLEYANANNIYALKSDEIVTAFLGIENENMKVLMQKLGMLDNTKIPDSIQTMQLNTVLAMTQEEKEHIKGNYFPVLMETIEKNKFSKQSDFAVVKEGVTYHTTAYRLSLNAEELKEVQIALLQALSQDSITLNLLTTKAKLLGLDEDYTQVNNLTSQIQNQINTIQNSSYLSNEGITITVYVEDGNVVTTEIILRNEMKYTFYAQKAENTSSRYLLIENLDPDAQYAKIELQESETRSNTESNYTFFITVNDEINLEIDLLCQSAVEDQVVLTTCDVIISKEESMAFHYEQEMIFEEQIDDILEVNRTNCAVLNDYTTEQIQPLLESIYQRILTVFAEKKQLVGWKD